MVIYIPTSPIALGSARKNEIADTSGQNELRLEGVWAQHYRSGEGLRAEPVLDTERSQLEWFEYLTMPLGCIPGEMSQACPTGRTRW